MPLGALGKEGELFMSKLKLFVQNCVLAFFAVTMCAGMVSCGSSDSDDEVKKDDSGVVTSGKKLVELNLDTDDKYKIFNWTFTYDKNGHVSSVVEKGDGNLVNVYTYEWKDNNTIIGKWNPAHGTTLIKSATCYLLDGVAVKYVDEYGSNSSSRSKTFTYTYNSSDQLSTVNFTGGYAFSNALLNWNSDKLTSVQFTNSLNSDYLPSSSTYTYNGKTCKGWYPLVLHNNIWYALTNFARVGMLFVAHPELVGLRNMNNLPSEQYDKDYLGGEGVNATTTYEYELDKEGYVVRCVAKTQTSGRGDIDADIEISTYTFKWE